MAFRFNVMVVPAIYLFQALLSATAFYAIYIRHL
ncbi:MAG: WzyE family oligosaccharide polymerase [Candidatus Malihini olakiniferum]